MCLQIVCLYTLTKYLANIQMNGKPHRVKEYLWSIFQ